MADGTGAVPLGHEVFQIDTRMAGYDGITAGYLIRGDRPCLVETGTAPSAPVVRDALAWLGIGAGDLATVVVTHIHLDHAGGAGDIAAMFPAAQIVVHQRGARHLADPAGSWPAPGWSTATRSSGSSACSPPFPPTASWRWTTSAPSISAAAGAWTATTPPATPSTTSAWSTPKPATCTSATRRACTCRKRGMSGRPRRRPTSTWTPRWPRCAGSPRCGPSRLLFSHFGPVTQVSETLDRSAEEITVWVEETRQARAAGLDLDHAVAMVRDRTKHRYLATSPDADPAIAEKFERVSGALGNVEGIMHWLGKGAV